MLPTLFADILTIAAPVDTPDGQGGVTRSVQTTTTSLVVPGRIEPFRASASGRSDTVNISPAGDVISATHLAYLPPATYNSDGSFAANVVIPPDSHIYDQAGIDYLVLGLPKAARLREGGVDHYEVPLRVLGGAI